MKPYVAKLFVRDLDKTIYKSIVVEEKELFKKGRCIVRFSWEGGTLFMNVVADDLSSFRSAMDHILRLIKVVEECEKLKL